MTTYQIRPSQVDRTGAARAQQFAIGVYLAEQRPDLSVGDLSVSCSEHANAQGKTMWWDVTVEPAEAPDVQAVAIEAR